MSRRGSEPELTVRIPADVERPDEILFGLSARQVAILAVVAVGLLTGWQTTRRVLPEAIIGGVAVIVAAAAVALVVGHRDGLALDQLLAAAIRQRLRPRRLVPATDAVLPVPAWIAAETGPLPAPLRLPPGAISQTGLVDLGRDGVAVVCACSTVNFGLRTAGERAGLIAGMGRWLNSLTGPVQIVVRADRLDLDPLITRLDHDAPSLPHPALEAAALEHAAWLAELGRTRDLLRRHVLLVLREPAATGGRDVAGARVLRRAQETARALAGCEVTVQILDGPAAAAVLTAAAAPHDPPPAAGAYTAVPGAVITGLTPHDPTQHDPTEPAVSEPIDNRPAVVQEQPR